MTSLVGRGVEARRISDFIAATHGEPEALLIEGEPGIGKTSLWLNALKRARDKGFRILDARANAAESVLAYATLADLLNEVEPDSWADLPAPQRRGLASVLLREDATGVREVDERAVGAAFLALLQRLTELSPVLVAIDDLQWVDGSSARAISFMARRMTGPAAMLCTARRDADTPSTAWLELGRPDAVHRMRLQPLTIGDMRDLITARCGDVFSRPRLHRIHEISGGNPFYALELAREEDRRDHGGAAVLPDSLAELTRARISRVQDGADDALLAIACLASSTIHVVAEAVGVDPQRLVEMLSLAEARGVVAIEGNRVVFTHPLLAHAVYLDAAAPRRRQMHGRLSGIVAEPELRARHLALADPAGGPRTLEALDGAAETARGRGAPTAAAELLELAISLGGATGERQIRLAKCLFDSGDHRGTRQVLERAVTQLTPGPVRAEALHIQALVRLQDGGLLEATELGQRALKDCLEQSALQVDILNVLAFTELNTNRFENAAATAAAAVAVAERVGLPEPLSRVLGMRAMIQFMTGDGAAANDLARAAALEGSDSFVPLPFRPSVHCALVQGWVGELEAARSVLGQLVRNCKTLGRESDTLFIAFHLVLIDIWRGDLRGATDTADDAAQRARQLGGDGPRFLATTMQATVAVYQGRVDDARSHLAEAMTAGAGSGYTLIMTWAIIMHGFLEASVGDHERALVAVQPLLAMAHAMPGFTEIIVAGFIPDVVEALINGGRYDEADMFVGNLKRNGARLDRAWMLAVGGRCRAVMLAARGDVTAAIAEASSALAQHDRVPMPFERARTLLLLGRLERRRRRPRAASAALIEALQVFETIGMPLWVAQARAELDRRSNGHNGSSALTPAEQRVADLARNGMNNRDIASALFISPKTVEVNLSRIYRKLGVRSRVEMYRALADADSAATSSTSTT